MPPQPPCFHTLQNQATTKSSQNIQPRLHTTKNYPNLPLASLSLPSTTNTKVSVDNCSCWWLICFLPLSSPKRPWGSRMRGRPEGETFATGPAHLAKGRNQMSGVTWKLWTQQGYIHHRAWIFGWEEVSFCRVFLQMNRWPSFVKLA